MIIEPKNAMLALVEERPWMGLQADFEPSSFSKLKVITFLFMNNDDILFTLSDSSLKLFQSNI